MKNDLAYPIRHIQLADFDSINNLAAHPQRRYVVWWYQSLALAHMYTEPDHQIDHLYDHIWNLVSPALSSYLQQEKDMVLLKKAFITASPSLDSLLADSLKYVLPADIPTTVPISVIICTANRPESLNACLASVFNQSCLPQEVVVVDNAPAKETEDACNQWPVLYVPEPKRGLSYARNTGIRNATQQILTWTDDDVTVHPLWCWRVWQAFEKNDSDALLGLVLASELETESQQVFEKYWSFNRGYSNKQYDYNWFRDRLAYGPPVWELGAGANMAFRKKIFNRVGDFDVRLGASASGCSEDSEMWFRILKTHGTILYDPKPIVFHTHRREMDVLKKQLHSYMKGFVVAALIQQKQLPGANYKRQLFRILPLHYLRLLKAGFPGFRARHATLYREITGIIKGFGFYLKNKKPF